MPTDGTHLILNTRFTTTHRFPTAGSVWGNRPRVARRDSASRLRRTKGHLANAFKTVWDYVRLLLMNLGLLAVPMRLRLNGANHAHSFYLLVDPPEGTEVETLYWRSLEPRDDDGELEESHYESPDSSQSILGCHHLSHDAGEGVARLNIRISGSGLRMIWLLVVGVFGIALYVLANSADREELPTVAGWLTAVVGALLALLNNRSSQLSTHLGRHLQRAILVLAIVAVVLGLRINAEVTSVRDAWWNHPVSMFEQLSTFGVAGLTAAYAIAVLLVLTSICFRGPARRSGDRDPAHADYATFAPYRKRRRLVSAGWLALAIASAVWTLDRYDVLDELFNGGVDTDRAGTTTDQE